MRWSGKAVVLCLLISMAAACAPMSSRRAAVQDPGTRLENAGYSVLPPEGEDWFLMRPSPGTMAFMKRVQPPAHTVSLAVMSILFDLNFQAPEEFRDFVEHGKRADTDPERFTLLDYRDSLDNRFGPFCVKYYMKSEDRKAQVRGEETALMILEVSGYVFIHPDAPDVVIDVNYSERYRKGEGHPKWKAIGEKFIDGFQTAPMK